jgi:putative ABC transport system permease protein
MNVVTRGIKNALRSPLRSGAIILMLAISIGLILSMLVARSSVDQKISEVKASTGTGITITPAGVRGFSGGGNALTSTELATVTSTAHISNTSVSLEDQLGTSDTNLTASLEMGNFGERQMRFETESNSARSTTSTDTTSSTSADAATDGAIATPPAMTARITVTGTTDANSISTDGSDLNITSGETFDGSSSDLVALVGTDLADKNNLTVGSTFTAYEKTIKVVGIFDTGNKFTDSGIIMPLATVQTLTDQTDAISKIVASVDSSDNVSSTVTTLKTALGTTADITSEIEQAETSVSSLASISSLALAGVIGATVAGAAIILLAMIIIVRERRHEIGVIKAIGGSNFKVVTQFVTEAMALTVIGSIIGLVLGVLVCGPLTSSLVSSQSSSTTQSAKMGGRPSNTSSSTSSTTGGAPEMIRHGFNKIGENFTQVTGTLTPTVFIAAIGITFLIAIVGSAIPVWFIARIRPAEVLRTE